MSGGDPSAGSGRSLEERASSFGSIAEEYDQWRPGPDPVVVDWLVPSGSQRVVDVGAGTGALTRLLIGRFPDVIAVEPDARMRSVLAARVPGATVLEGRGDRIPLPSGSADAVVASSAWHWMDTVATYEEVARVLRVGAVLGVTWSGIDRNGQWLSDLWARVAASGEQLSPRFGPILAGATDFDSSSGGGAGRRPARRLEIPGEVTGFGPVEHTVLRWTRPVSADQLVGMIGTFSRVILLPAADRAAIADDARRLLRDVGGIEGDDAVELPFAATCWRLARVAD